jgi:16S rRNA (guanine527-N7)-methyltransferase
LHEELERYLSASHIDIPVEGYEKLEAYHRILMEWNSKIDLTNVPESDMAIRHYADSLLVLSVHGLFVSAASVIDLGSGAGFPGLPLAIARPDLKVCLLDSLKKRCLFLEDVCVRIGLSNVTIINARAEDAANGTHREMFDLATARALAHLPVLAEYMLPFLKIGGKALCWKGPALASEINQAHAACHILGGEIGERLELPLPGRQSYIQVLYKTSKTVKMYPRKSGIPSKSPLGTDMAGS